MPRSGFSSAQMMPDKTGLEGWTYTASQVGGATHVQLERVGSGYASAISSDGAPMVDLEASPGNLALNQLLYVGRPGIDMEKDFTPLSHVASLPFTLTINSEVPEKSVKTVVVRICAHINRAVPAVAREISCLTCRATCRQEHIVWCCH